MRFFETIADMGHEQVDRSVREVLKLMREHLAMDVAFASRFLGGRRILWRVEAIDPFWQDAEGSSDALERSFCQRVVDGRLPRLVTDVRRLPSFAAPSMSASLVSPLGSRLRRWSVR